MIILLLLLHRVRSFPDLFYFYFIDSSFSAALLCSVSVVICSRYRIVISGLIRWNSQDFDPAKKKEACWYWFFRLILIFVVDREWFFSFCRIIEFLNLILKQTYFAVNTCVDKTSKFEVQITSMVKIRIWVNLCQLTRNQKMFPRTLLYFCIILY